MVSAARSQFPGSGEGLEAAVVGFLRIGREAAAGKLLRGQVIAETLTADALIVTSGIRATAVLQVLRFLAFHRP